MLSVIALNIFEIIPANLCEGLLKLCLGSFMVMYTIKSINDKEIALGAQTVKKEKSPEIYWIFIIASIIFEVIFVAFAIYLIVKDFI